MLHSYSSSFPPFSPSTMQPSKRRKTESEKKKGEFGVPSDQEIPLDLIICPIRTLAPKCHARLPCRPGIALIPTMIGKIKLKDRLFWGAVEQTKRGSKFRDCNSLGRPHSSSRLPMAPEVAISSRPKLELLPSTRIRHPRLLLGTPSRTAPKSSISMYVMPFR